MDGPTLAGLLADDGRRRVTAALVLGSRTLDEVTAATGLSMRLAVTAIGRLVSGGLVQESADGAYAIIGDAFMEAARSSRPDRGDQTGVVSESEEEARVFRAFVRDGQLIAIPTTRAKRMVILNRLAVLFEPGVRYEEWEVNAMLRRWHPDTAALRRYLVDEEFLGRDHGEYWRTGGPVDVS